MKRSKRLLSLLLAVMLVLTTVVSATMVSTSAAGIENSALCSEYYATNPNNQVGKQATITIDGDFSDWSSDMLVAKGAAWDVANHYKGGHENCVLDTIGLYAAWDSQNLYVAWQMVNTTDTWQREGDASLSDGGRVLDVPLILALSVDPSSPSMTNKIAGGNNIWDMKAGVEFTSHVDHLFYMSGKAGLGKPAMFTAVDESGNTNYSTGCKEFAAAGISYGMAEGNISDSIWGLNFSENPSDVTDAAADWVDYSTFKGQMGTHNTKYDSFYEIKIPFTALGIDANYLANNGIGAMLVATRGESGIDCIPFDTTMLDNVLGDYGSDDSTSHEKDDVDNITVPFARIGKSGSGAPVIPTTPIATDPAVTDPVVIPTTTEVPVVTAPTTEGTGPIIIPPVTTDSVDNTTEIPDIVIPTLDTDSTTDPTETKEPEITTDGVNPPVITPAEGILGDADENEKVNIKDATLIQKHLAKIETLNENAEFLSNVDANEILNIRDVTYIQKWIAKMPVEYAIGEPVSKGEIIIPTVVETEATEAPIVIPTVVTPTETTTTEPTEVIATSATDATEPTQTTTEIQPVVTDPTTAPVYTDPIIDYGTITIYFENSNGWSNVCWYAWNEAGDTSTAWPGDAMTYVEGNVYSATISANYTGIIFNDGTMEGAKTDNLTVGGDGQIYKGGSWTTYVPNDNPIIDGNGKTVYFSNNKGWSSVNAYCWSGDNKNAEWPGVQMTFVKQNEFNEDIYSYVVPDGMTNIIFTGDGAQSVDIDLNSVTDNGFYLTDSAGDGKFAYDTYAFQG